MSLAALGTGTLNYFDGTEWKSVGETVGGDLSAASVLEMCRNWPYTGHLEFPARGGTMTLNSVALGEYDWVYKQGNQTTGSQTEPWFTGTIDTHSAWVLVNGDLTIASDTLLRPPFRKLFTVIYVSGDLIVNGRISMTARGANHNGTLQSGGSVTSGAIRIATGTFSGVTDPEVPAAGGAGGAGGTNAAGSNGSAGSGGGTGGGGGGTGLGTSSRVGVGGDGSAGTSFCGGSGGGGAITTAAALVEAGDAESNGGKGGFGIGSGNGAYSEGGGNPPGDTQGTARAASYAVQEGNGGVCIIIVEGELSGAGVIDADGKLNGAPFRSGGATGGGSITIMYGTDTSTITPTASGGISAAGGNGGAGTARKLAL